MIKRSLLLAPLLAAVCAIATVATAADFPLRAKYPNAPTISVEELNSKYNDVLVVDVRSKFEFDVIHVANAHLLPMSDRTSLKTSKHPTQTEESPLSSLAIAPMREDLYAAPCARRTRIERCRF